MPAHDHYTIDVHNISKRYHRLLAVDDINIKIPTGQIFGFMGPNGSGKTTTMRILAGLIEPTCGQGSCLGYDLLTQRNKIRQHVGYMPQYFSLYRRLTVRENIRLIAKLCNLDHIEATVSETLQRFDLSFYQDYFTEKLSGGWRQRLALAVSMLQSPKLLLLDEPTAGVDPESRQIFWHLIQQISSEGTTVLVSTHYMDEAQQCHGLLYLAGGKMLATGHIDSIIAQTGLHTFAVTGPDLVKVEARINALTAVVQTTVFGRELRVSTLDKQFDCKQLAQVLPADYHCQAVSTLLDDSVTYLMKQNHARTTHE